MMPSSPSPDSAPTAGKEEASAPAASSGEGSAPDPALDAGQGTFCPRCGFLVHFDLDRCPGCGHDIYHNPSKVQRYGLLAGLGFIILGGILVFLQPKAYHTIEQDLFECGIIICVIGAGISFFTAVVDMVRRGGE